ncbi:MAG TPA: polysaccharide pyruvyl transferase family protein [Pilimelia sp.]|nr:polysaccharide pyruvyl transferase family protein [Pilimelia sp.]
MVIHHVFANRSNAGDWLAALGIQSQLGGYRVAAHLCDAPFVRHTVRRLSTLDRADLVVVGGGGLVMDYFQPLWEGLAALGDRVPYVLWGVGAVDLKREPSRLDPQLVRGVAARAALCRVRDEHTRALLGGAPLPAAVPCPSVLAVRPVHRPGWGVLHVDNLTTVGEAEYEAMGRAAARFAARTGRPYRETNNLHRVGDRAALAGLLAHYAAADVVVTSRLHGCLIAAATGRRVVAVSGDWKIESFMSAVGLGAWVLPQADVARLPELLARLDAQPDPGPALARARRTHRRIGRQVRRLAETARG